MAAKKAAVKTAVEKEKGAALAESSPPVGDEMPDAIDNEEPNEADNIIWLSGQKFELTMPRGRKGKDAVIKAQVPYENALKAFRESAGREEELLAAARHLFEHKGFQNVILPFVLENTTRGFTHQEALDFWDENADSVIHVMLVYLNAMSFFLAGSNPGALSEAVGK